MSVPNKKINAFPPASDARVADNNTLWAIGDPVTGQLFKATGTQAKGVFGATLSTTYRATGSEGVTLTISALAGKQIVGIWREGSAMYEVETAPDSTEFIWNGTSITLGLGVSGAGERYLILYRA